MPESQNKPKVFISYSHDSDQHKDRVLALSDRLREDGIDCIIDQYETSPPEMTEKSVGKNHPNFASGLRNLAALLRKTNREAEAREMEARARGMRKTL
jgi:hypothetical protein